MDQNGVNTSEFQKENVAHEVRDERGILHHRTTDFDEKGLSSKALQIGQSLDEDGSLGLGVSHGGQETKDSGA